MPPPQYDEPNAADDAPAGWFEWTLCLLAFGIVALVVLGRWAARH